MNALEELRRAIAEQNLLAARSTALVIKCEYEAWKSAHAHRDLMQLLREERGHA